jgi:hypothetical protein
MSFRIMRPVSGGVVGAAVALWLAPAHPHAVCGDRIFPATLAIDDPGVGDELALPTISWVPTNPYTGSSQELDATFSWTKTITPNLGLTISDGGTWQHPGGYGWAALDTELKYKALCIPDAEFMFSVGFDISWAGTGTGTQAGSGALNTYSPVLNAGLGFGALPKSLNYLRPFAITAEFGTSSPGQNWTNGAPNVTTFNWGFTLQYSLPYFNSNVAGIDNEFIKRLIPIAEFAFQTPIYNGAPAGQVTTAAFQPGVIYSANTWQFALEAVIPLNSASGHGIGVVGELHFYFDDIFPNTLGRPIFPNGLGTAPGI